MSAVDTFATYIQGLTTPAEGAEVVIPHAVNEQSFICKGLYVGVAGDVTALMKDDSVVLYKNLPIGVWPIRCKRINAIGTSATNMLFLK